MKRIMSWLIVLAAILLLNVSSGYAFELNGFADVSFTKSIDAPDGEEFRNGDFAFGTLDLYLAESLENIEILTELVVEEGDVLDLERLTLGYTFSDALRLRAGRFHTPIGFWNTSYHHGVQLQPTIQRPAFLNFEDDHGILPTHEIGVILSGRANTSAGVVEYGAIVGNGPKVSTNDNMDGNVLNPNNISDNSIGKAIAFNAAISPEMVQGLKVGVSGHITRVQGNDLLGSIADVDVNQTILNASLAYTIANIDLMGEYYSIKNKDKGTTVAGSNTSTAYYGLLTYTYKDKWVPYVLYENLSAKKDDPYFISLGIEDLKKTTVGLRYNINFRSSLKGEFRSVDETDGNWQEYAVQWALAF